METTSPSPSIAFNSQVGGHGGILSSSDGAVIIKPCLPLEAAFYKALSSNSAYAPLTTIVPKFYGTLALHGHLDEEGDIIQGHVPLSDPETEKEHLVLENLTHTFLKPNVIDIKLGTILWGEDASPEKRLRMEKTARETTSFETGVRITGFNVYDYTEGKVINTTKAYGKALKKQDLPTGITKCFPLAVSDFPQNQGLPRDMLQQVLKGIITEIKEIVGILKQFDCYMAGVSLLIIYEADWDILKQALQDWPPKNIPILTQKGEEEEEEEEEEAKEEEEEAADSLDEHMADDEESEESDVIRYPYVVKLIDFAHTTLEKRHDTGIIRGLETTIGLLTNRLQDISDVPL